LKKAEPTGAWWCSVVYGGAWWFAVVYGGVWRCMVVYGGVWWCMVVYGGVWWCMVVHGGAWWCMVVYCMLVSMPEIVVVPVIWCRQCTGCFAERISDRVNNMIKLLD
jgi:hypothetical protein